jgi:hypothetical protein
MSSKETLFDRRIIARQIKHGRTSRKEFEQYLESLPDVSAKAVPMLSGPAPRAAAARARPEESDEELENDEQGE